ncbi:MAG: VOC family protein [bacterium]
MASTKLDPYLFFAGNCREAMECYHSIFGGELKITTMGEAMGEHAGDRKDQIMHADLSGGGIELMASDSDRKESYETSCISLSISGTDSDTITGYFNALAEGGKITTELKKESWGDMFGTVTDKFGIDWMVNIGEA